jgi:hypothetical protein
VENRRRIENVYENKGSYSPNAGISLNTKDLSVVPREMDNMLLPTGEEKAKWSKMNERSGNVYENKGPLWKTGEEAGMSMKIKVVIRKWQVCY